MNKAKIALLKEKLVESNLSNQRGNLKVTFDDISGQVYMTTLVLPEEVYLFHEIVDEFIRKCELND